MTVEWEYFDKFEQILDKYLPDSGEGETKATQIVTVVNRIIYRWYNDGDIFDNTYIMDGQCDLLPSCANWLRKNTDSEEILDKIKDCRDDGGYENILKELADKLLNEKYLEEENKIEKVDSIYDCDGIFDGKDLSGYFEY